MRGDPFRDTDTPIFFQTGFDLGYLPLSVSGQMDYAATPGVRIDDTAMAVVKFNETMKAILMETAPEPITVRLWNGWNAAGD